MPDRCMIHPKRAAKSAAIIIPAVAPRIAARVLSSIPAIIGRVRRIDIMAIKMAIGRGAYPFRVRGMKIKNRRKLLTLSVW